MKLSVSRAAPILACLLLWPVNANAQQPAPNPADVAFASAREKFELGARLLREGKREHNATKLERAYVELKAGNAVYGRSKAGLLDLIESELATTRILDAMKHLRDFERQFGKPPPSTEFGRAFREQWDQAYPMLGHVDVEAPPGARIVLDLVDEKGVAPLSGPLDVPAGHHVIEAVAQERMRTEVDAAPGATTKAVLTVHTTPPATMEPALAATSLQSPSPGSEPPSPSAVPDSPDISPSRSFWTPLRVWGSAIGGVGVVSLGLGAFFAVQANNDADRAANLRATTQRSGCFGANQSTACQSLQSALSDQARDHTLDVVFFAAGATASALGLGLVLWPQPRAKVAVVPMLSPQMGGLQLRGEL